MSPDNSDMPSKVDKYWINNYRMGGYLLFACGLINLRYQWGEPDIVLRSALIFGPGAAVLGATFVPGLATIMNRRVVKVVTAIAGVAVIVFAFSN